jgi:putative Ca2+/H+ antiporter (TMEM165/GDT1 family)
MLLQEGESELEEVERELGSKQAKTGGKTGINGDAGRKAGIMGHLKALFPPVFLEAFVLTFLAEWGDRSQVIICNASLEVYASETQLLRFHTAEQSVVAASAEP